MTKELEEMTFDELQAQIATIQSRMTEMKDQKRKAIKQQIIDLAASIGETPDSLFGLKPKKGSKSPPKFRHPDDPALTWTGRGKPPRWITELEQAGHKRDEYLIE